MAQAQVTITAVDKTQNAINSAMRGLKGIGDQASLLKRAFAGIGVAAVGQFLTRTASAAIQYGDEIAKATAKSGIAAEAFSSLAYAAKQSDIDLNSLSTALRKMQIALSEASSGGKSQKEALDALGLSLKEIQALNPDRQFELIADRISMLTDPADRARAATELFGKAGADLLPMFESGAEGIRAAREEAERLGAVLSTEQAQALAQADDAIKRLGQSYDAFATTLIAKAAPALTKFFDVLSGQTGAMTLIPGFTEKALGAKIGPTRSPQEIAAANAAFANAQKNMSLPGFKDSEAAKKEATRIAKEAQQAFDDHIEGIRVKLKNEQEIKDYLQNIEDSVANTFFDINEKVSEDVNALIENIGAGIPDLSDKFDGMTEFARTAAQNIQNIFANFLFDPFEGGLRGMLSSFVNMLRQMVAQLIAQQILLSFFGMFTGGTGMFANFAKAAVSSLSGTRAMCGPVSSGKSYLVGERGPEIFVPNASGNIVPNNKMGGITLAPVYNIDARGATADLQKALPNILKENNRRIFDELDRRYGIGR